MLRVCLTRSLITCRLGWQGLLRSSLLGWRQGASEAKTSLFNMCFDPIGAGDTNPGPAADPNPLSIFKQQSAWVEVWIFPELKAEKGSFFYVLARA